MNEVITLKYPVTVNGQQMEQLTMRRPKVKDTLAANKAKGSDADREITLFANLCEQTPHTIEELDMADYQQLQERYTSFLS